LVLISFVISQTTVSPVSQTLEYFTSSRLLDMPGCRANALRFRQDLLAESAHDLPVHEPAHDHSPVPLGSSRGFDETRHDLFERAMATLVQSYPQQSAPVAMLQARPASGSGLQSPSHQYSGSQTSRTNFQPRSAS